MAFPSKSSFPQACMSQIEWSNLGLTKLYVLVVYFMFNFYSLALWGMLKGPGLKSSGLHISVFQNRSDKGGKKCLKIKF